MNRRKLLADNKAQLKILESIAVLIVFFFLVGIGINFYGKIQLQSLKEAKDELASNDATKTSQKIIHLPELRCSLQNTDQGSCIDLYQAMAWSRVQAQVDTDCVANPPSTTLDQSLCTARITHYFEEIGVAEVVLKRLYSADLSKSQDQTWVLYNYTTDASVKGNTRVTFTQIPVVIYDSVAQVKELGILQVKVFE